MFQVAIGDGKNALTCLGQCEEVFSLSVLQDALKANTFSKWLHRIQISELEQAGIEGLEQCPFCPFATIIDTLPEENKHFVCRNPDCGKDSCRICKEISHIPLRCEEVEKDAEVRQRTYIENKMSEALIRKCYKCTKPFVRTQGCRHMTCPCGAQMCYLCKKPWKACIQSRKCNPSLSNEAIHERDVARGALEAKTEMAMKNPEVELKHDPTKAINLNAASQQDIGNINVNHLHWKDMLFFKFKIHLRTK